MDDLRFYFSIFRRRLAYFLVVATIASAVSVTVAYTLPPAYVSRMILLVESPQIPPELAASTVRTPAFEQLQVVQQRLLTRAHMLDIARRLNVLPDLEKMNPDEIVNAMRARTSISTSNRRRQEAPLMTIAFEAARAQTAANVLNEYLVLIQQQDTEFRKGRSGDTLEFFTQEIERLSEELDLQGARILEFKQANVDALPESLQFRLDQQAVLQDRLARAERNISDLENQRDRLIQLYEVTGQTETAAAPAQLSPEERQLEALQTQLEEALLVYSQENPRVRLLQARIDQQEARVDEVQAQAAEAAAAASAGAGGDQEDLEDQADVPAALAIQLSEIDSRVAVLKEQVRGIQTQLEALNEGIARSPGVSIALEELERKRGSLQKQYNLAEDRLSKAQTGDRIETRSRGQRLTVIEQPVVPSAPTKPNRVMIAGGGVGFGVFAGLALIVLMELLNNTARRPEDIVRKLGVTPLTTLPYTRTRGQLVRQRGVKLLLVLAILIGVPAVVYALHLYYLPLDIIAEKVMNKLGVRW